MKRHIVIAFLCAKLRDRHLEFECSALHSNVHFYLKFDEYSGKKLAALLSGAAAPALGREGDERRVKRLKARRVTEVRLKFGGGHTSRGSKGQW